LGNIPRKIKNISSNINNILFIDKRIDRKTKLNTKVVLKALYQLRIEQLGTTIVNYIVYI